MNTKSILTIGHSTHDIEQFINLLILNRVTVIADVRSSPYSRFNPQFNRECLKRELGKHSIKYVFLGKELGARSDDPSCYENGRVQYGKLAKTELFRSGIDRILEGIKAHNVALMCAEKEPLDCHRTILVSQELAKDGISVTHILADGTQEPHESTLSRLLEIVGLPAEDLFRSKEELLSDAIMLQEQKIAYTETSSSNEKEEAAA